MSGPQTESSPDAIEAGRAPSTPPRGVVAPPPRLLRFPLAPPPLLSPGLLNATLAVVALTLAIAQPVLQRFGQMPVLLPLTALFGTAPLLLAWLFRGKPRPGVIEVFLERLHLPLPGGSFAEVRVRELTALHLLEARRGGHLWLGTEAGAFIYELSRFQNLADARRLYEALRERIAALPDGERRLEAFALEASVARQASARPATASRAMVALLVAFYLAQHALGAFETPFDVVRFGANVRSLVAEGQVWRLATASFLHHEMLAHLYLNALAILGLGALVERLYGPSGFLLVFLVSALSGAAASALVGDAPSISLGASTAAYGLLGAFAFTVRHYRGRLPLGFEPAPSWWGLLLLANLLLLGVAGELIDMSAHFGGFLGGVVVIGLLVSRDPPLPYEGALPLGGRLALYAVAASTLAGLCAAAHSVVRGTHADGDRILAEQVEYHRSSAAALNNLAWMVATSAGARPAQLELAEEAASRAEQLADRPEERAPIVDTLATVLVRRGALDRAIELEREVLRLDSATVRDTAATQLAEMLAVRRRREGRPLVDPLARGVEVKLEQHRFEERVGFEVSLSPPPVVPMTVLARVLATDVAGAPVVGVVRARWEPARSTQDAFYVPPELARVFDRPLTFEVLELRPGDEPWAAWVADPGMLLLPRTRVLR